MMASSALARSQSPAAVSSWARPSPKSRWHSAEQHAGRPVEEPRLAAGDEYRRRVSGLGPAQHRTALLEHAYRRRGDPFRALVRADHLVQPAEHRASGLAGEGVDIALCASAGDSAASESSPGVVLYHLWSEPMVFVCRPDHPLGDRDRLAAPGLGGEMILRFPPGWGVRAIVDSALGATQSAFEIIDYTLMFRLVRAGFGTTLVPASAVQGERGEGLRAIAVDGPHLRWNLSAAVGAHRQLTAATKTLLVRSSRAASDGRRGGPAGSEGCALCDWLRY